MGKLWLERLVAAALGFWLASVAGTAAQEREPRGSAEEERSAADTISSLLERRIRGKANPDDVVIDVFGLYRGGIQSAVRIHGNGVGVWNHRVQFRLSKHEVIALLKAAKAARFGSLPDAGGEEEHEEKRRGVITVSIGRSSKTVTYADEGEESRRLERLAQRILRTSESAVEHGVGATSFADGFQKVVSGELDPEVFEVLLRRTAGPAEGSAVGGSWLVQLDGRLATDRVFSQEKEGGVSIRELRLSEKEFRSLLAILREADPATLPETLYAAQYTNLRLQVLDYGRNITARQFPGMTPETRGEKQQAFDRVADALVALHRRLRKEGTVVPPPAPEAPREHETDKDEKRPSS